jgi:indolepyruvate ferredoxin oxidoreductase, beta subunit
MTSAVIRPITISISALGGQGGAVLTQWIVDLAEASGFYAQSTSVPGVAQRTGATIYYVELFSKKVAEAAGKKPILALMPVPGDVDICIASELMEAGRAVERKFVSPNATTLISSTHRVYAISEKEKPGDARVDSNKVIGVMKKAAKTCITFDMQAAADETGSVISSVMFGALAGSHALPFPASDFEKTIRNTGRAVETNLKGFRLGFFRAENGDKKQSPTAKSIEAPAQEITTENWHQLIDYQDMAYANLYLDRVKNLQKSGLAGKALAEASRYLGLWMAFHDVIRVAELKTQKGRSALIRKEVQAKDDQITKPMEYFHPRWEEFCDILPKALGKYLETSKLSKWLLGWAFDKDRLIGTNTLMGFIPLYLLAGLKGWRIKSYRFERENIAIQIWLDLLPQIAACNPEAAFEVAQLPRLIKGYGKTHARGAARYDALIVLARTDMKSPDLAKHIRNAVTVALSDNSDAAFHQAMQQA